MTATRINLLAFACALSAINLALALPNSRILGGQDAVSEQFPSTVSVRVNNFHVAVGSIIGDKYILTSANQLSQLGATPIDVNTVTVRCGSINQFAGGEIVGVSNIQIHPSYGNFLHDIAVITLSRVLTPFTSKINKIAIAASDAELDADTAVLVAGWGLESSGASPYKLQRSQMSVLNAPECELQAGYSYVSALCLQRPEGQGICNGDSGAPNIVNDVLVGVSSFAFGNCGTKYPDISGRVSYYNQWINSIIA